MGCVIITVKCVLVFVNCVTVICGLILLVPSIISEIKFGNAYYFLDGKLNTPTIVVTTVGALLLVVGFFGFCGVLADSVIMIRIYAALVVLLLLVEVTVGITALIYRKDLHGILYEKLLEAIQNYGNDNVVVEAIDRLQLGLECCGVQSHADYNKTELPSSCCAGCSPCSAESDKFFKKGCKPVLTDFINSNGALIGGIAIGIAVLEVIVIIFSCTLAASINKQEIIV